MARTHTGILIEQPNMAYLEFKPGIREEDGDV